MVDGHSEKQVRKKGENPSRKQRKEREATDKHTFFKRNLVFCV